MKLYSDFGPRRAWQIVADVVSLVLIAVWVWFGATVYALISELASLGRQLEDAGAGFRDTMTEIGDNLGGIVLIGPTIRMPFEGASTAGAALEDAGRGQQDLVHQFAVTLGVGGAALPILLILTIWLIPRLRFARRAGQARALVRAGAGIDLFALRALAHRTVTSIAAVDADAMGAWRRGDARVTRELAALELESAGVRLPD